MAARFRVNLATIMLGQDRLSEAQQELVKAETELGTLSSIEGLMGYILERQGNTQEAEAKYRKTISLDSASSFTHNLVILLSANRQFAEASEAAYRGIERAPTSWRILYALGILTMDQAAEYHEDSYYGDAVKYFQDGLDILLKEMPNILPMEDRAKIHFHMGYAYAKLGRARSATDEFRKAKKYSRRYSRTWFATESNLRRYQRKLTPTASQRSQAALFSTLGAALIAGIVILEFSQELTNPYLITLIAFAILLFIMAFYLPIVTNIRLGPVALEKQAVRISTELPEPIGSPRMPLDIASSQWRIDQPSPMGAYQAPPLPARPTPRPTKPRTPPWSAPPQLPPSSDLP
jgi:tetratricopeptide (TPR) repeat protein